MLNFEEAMAFISSLAKKGSDFSLDGINAILDRLQNPQNKLKIIHIAGTNGKGSTATYLSNILISSGYSVGTFLTPAVFSYLEVFKVNNTEISKEDFVATINQIYPIYLQLKNTYNITSFMIEVAICYTYFYNKKVDFAIIECGLGGLYDATNVEKSNILSIITQIAVDHSSVLGSIEDIAKNKCGIIRDSAVITTKSNTYVQNIIENNAKLCNANLIVADIAKSEVDTVQKLTYKSQVYTTKMLGEYQKINLPLAIEATNYLKELGYNITDKSIKQGIENSFIAGRFEVLQHNPLFIIDGAHNENASTYMQNFIKNNKDVTLIIGIFKDKDYKSIVKNTAIYATKIYTFDWDNSRALSGLALKQEIEKYNKNVEYTTLKNAVNQAKQDKNEIVVAFGSLSFLNIVKAEVKNGWYKKNWTGCNYDTWGYWRRHFSWGN